MKTIQPAYSNRVRYTLINETYGTTRILEPIGYETDDKEFKREIKIHGVFRQLSNDLKFHKGSRTLSDGTVITGGYDYILGVYQQQGVNADILLIKEERNGKTDIWEVIYRSFADLSTLSRENNQLSVKFNESGMYAALKARQNEKIELERLTTMDGVTIDPLVLQTVAMDGRKILEVSELFTKSFLSFTGSPNSTQARTFPLVPKVVESGNVQTIVEDTIPLSGENYDNGVTGIMFYADADITTDLKLIMDLHLDMNMNGSSEYIKIELITYSGGESYIFKEKTTLAQQTSISSGSFVMDFEGTQELTLQTGESLALGFIVKSTNSFTYSFIFTASLLDIEVQKFFNKTQSKFLLPKEALERLVHITTGEQNAIRSTLFNRTDLDSELTEDGEGALIGITNGFKIRNFDDKNITTSFKDFTVSWDTIYNTGYGIERKGLSEFLRMEVKDYFYQKVVTIILPFQVSSVKRTVAKELIYSGLDLGYKKPEGDRLYDEAMGLDEYNTKSTFTSIIKRIEKIYRKESSNRSDSAGMEFARRKNITSFSTEDTRYDNEIFFMDNKRGPVEVFEQRLWQDDFAKAPTGIFSPETAQNLRLSPFNILLRHGWWVRAGLEDYKNSFIRFASSNGNSELSTQLIGGNEYAENGDIVVNELEDALFLPEWIDFDHPVDISILKQIEGTTVINGAEVWNVYGMVEFINEDGYLEYGFLFSMKPNGKGKWRLLKTNKTANRKYINDEPLVPFFLDAPLNLAGTPSGESVSLTWDESVSSQGIKNYQVYMNGSIVGNPTTNSFNVTGLTDETEYTFSIKAVDIDGNESDFSAEIQVTTLLSGSMILSTTSTSSSWSPFSVTNLGDTLTWDSTGGFVGTIVADDPTFDLSTNSGIANMSVYNVEQVTILRIQSLNLTSLNPSELKSVTRLDIDNNSLTTIDTSELTELELYRCHNNNFTTLDLSNNTLLTFVECFSNSLTSIIGLSNLTLLNSFNCFGNSLTTIDLTSSVNLTTLFCYNNSLTSLNVTGLSSITTLFTMNNTSLISVTGLSSCTDLTSLRVDNCAISTFSVLALTLLDTLQCQLNSFSAALTNQLLADLVANGFSGTLHYRNNETGQGITDRAQLIINGATITNYAT